MQFSRISVALMTLALSSSVMLGGAEVSPAASQTPPSPAQVEDYRGLHLAAHDGDIAAIRRLLAEGADIDARDDNGRTPLIVAAFASREEAVASLAEAGADVNALDEDRYDMVTIAAVADDVAMLKAALSVGNRADLVTSRYDGTALIAAAHLGHAEVVGILLEAGAPVDHINNLGWTALIEAVVLGDGGPAHTETVKRLLAAGADRDIGDRAGQTPLDHARLRGYTEMIGLLSR